MLKTNSKQARQNVQAYIMQGFTGENYSIETPETFKDTAAVIMKIFNSEKPAEEKARYSEQNAEQLLTALIYRELVRGCK